MFATVVFVDIVKLHLEEICLHWRFLRLLPDICLHGQRIVGLFIVRNRQKYDVMIGILIKYMWNAYWVLAQEEYVTDMTQKNRKRS